MNTFMRTIVLATALSLLVVGCDDNKKTDNVSQTKDICSSTTDYETGLKNGLRVAPPCDITNNGSYKDKCNGDYKSTTWTNCFGERTLPNGEKYRGGYLEGKANGKGEYVNADGSRYLGYYEKGKRNGYGKEYDSKGEVVKEGQWRTGIFKGESQQSTDVNAQGNSSGSPTLKKISECFVLNATMSTFMEQVKGDTELAVRFSNSARTWGEVLKEYSTQRGIAAENFISLNRIESTRVSKILGNGPVSFDPYAEAMMSRCNQLLKDDNEILSIYKNKRDW
jgi:hypothetical protein